MPGSRSRGRAVILKRRRIFVAGEGVSETSFLAAVQEIANGTLGADVANVHLVREDLKGGDPLSMAKKAVSAARRDAANRGAHRSLWAFLDADRTNPVKAAVEAILAPEGIRLVLQNPCFEGLLLHHFVGRERAMPATCADAEAALRTLWPTYRKPPIVRDIRDRVGVEDLRRYGRIEAADYADFLSAIGIL
ncbi:RloB domain-containing protein [Thalassobaculum sp.]|uniref:RloB domain-containing protein n=1 Tax=Thalassobaculum sp. TaxID=2022740 RepID=UPI0032F064E9